MQGWVLAQQIDVCPHLQTKVEQNRGLFRIVMGLDTWLVLSAKRKLRSSMTAFGK